MPDNMDRQQAVGLVTAVAAAAALLYSIKRKNGKKNLPDGSKDDDLIGAAAHTHSSCAVVQVSPTVLNLYLNQLLKRFLCRCAGLVGWTSRLCAGESEQYAVLLP